MSQSYVFLFQKKKTKKNKHGRCVVGKKDTAFTDNR